MSVKAFQREIPKRQAHCVAGNELLAAGTIYHSLLLENEEGAIVRQDYCVVCWEQLMKQGIPSGTYWKARVAEGKEEPKVPTDRYERALYFLKEAIAKDENEEAFILALYLAHQRVIVKRKETQEEGQWYYLYEIQETEEMLAVKKVVLAHLQIEALQAAVAAKLR